MQQLSLFPDPVIPPDFDALRRCLAAAHHGGPVAVDVETETRWPGFGPRIDYGLTYPAPITLIALAWREGESVATTALAAPFEAEARHFLRDLFAAAAPLAAHNAVFDLRQLSRLTDGEVARHIWDTASMARLLSPAVDASYSLIGVARALGIDVPEQTAALKSRRGKLHLLPREQALAYAQDDARLALLICEQQCRLPGDPDLIDWECRAVYEYCLMAARGVRFNAPYVADRLDALRAERATIAERLRADGLASPRNAQARARYLYENKRLPLPVWPDDASFFTRAGRRRMRAEPERDVTYADLSTNAGVVEEHRARGGDIDGALDDLAAFQAVDWLVSTLEGLVDHACLDGRLHSLVTIATDTGRRASSQPHMQNWKMPEMAGVAVGDDGCTLVEIDYRNAENIMAALISGDDALAAACATRDFHATMAAEYFGAAWEAADPTERKRLRDWSKRITYGTNYGMGAKALGRGIGVSEDEARRWMRAKDAAFPAVTRARREAQRTADRTGLLRLWTGRPIAVPAAFVAWNYLCQGGVSEAVKRAIVVLSEGYRARGMRSRVALDMHDALVIEVAHDEWDAALALACAAMVGITPLELGARTTPPTRWIAQPNLVENRRKWGATQPHPGLDAAD